MSGFFYGRNGRLSKPWRFRRCGKSVKTLGDLGDLGDLQFEEIWDIFSLRRSVGTGNVAVLPGKFEEPLESYLSPSRGAVWGYPVFGLTYEASGVCTRCMRRYGYVW